VSHRRLASPLHAARASVGAAFCAVLAAGGLVEHPLLLAGVGAAVLAAAAGAGVLGDLRRIALFAVPLALVFAFINTLVVREGLTVFARLGEVPPVGQVDLTVEALVYGLILGARIVVVILAFAVFSACVDPDELLRIFRRVSFRSGLTAALATRTIPVLVRDAQRLELARRCRPDGGGTGMAARTAVLRAVTSSSLDRALDVAATLEVRGYGLAQRPPASRQPWSRHDISLAAATATILVVLIGSRIAGVGEFTPYPLTVAPTGGAEVAVMLAILVAAALPFLDRRGIAR
jgi:energy-coupling factor transport system permease protein